MQLKFAPSAHADRSDSGWTRAFIEAEPKVSLHADGGFVDYLRAASRIAAHVASIR